MIDILLATYNGEKYIESQLYSLLAQTHKEWQLIIHDDGSTDNTIDIIKRFQALDSRIIFIEDGIRCGGAGTNFLHLLKHSKADYTIFCDQDDIWLENKLEVMHKRIHLEKEPCAVFVGGYLYSDKKGIMGTIPSPLLKEFKDLFFIAGGLQGCSLMFNKRLRELVVDYDGYMVMHDFLLTIAAITFGKLVYINKELMLYRQGHEAKVTSNVERGFIKRIANRFPVVDENHHRSLIEFIQYYKDRFSENQRKLIVQYLKIYSTQNILVIVYLVVKNGFKLNQSTLYLLFKILLRPLK
ncbi:hypothetical protein CAPN006_07270 [Capnocytophaga canimorsus]|uniref:glycosyltransferase family 2 protein n=1 Tax=Capnocytophaga canimorsus TaxID=28188 RepID=UPI001AC99EBC|nr:glycosyltransferase family 2 protein [Capnocytophaga canimorsus]GIM56333.1 hypothetical protein CAPN006_07270 [Capnocytophaga canimorsus]